MSQQIRGQGGHVGFKKPAKLHIDQKKHNLVEMIFNCDILNAFDDF